MMLGSDWLDYGDYAWSPFTGGDAYGFGPTERHGGTPSGSITIPQKTIELPGLGEITLGGGTWSVGGGGGSNSGSLRDLAVRLSNQYEAVLQQNLQAYQTRAISKETAADNFNRIWQAYLTALDAAGPQEKAAAVADRQAGGKFDWFNAYLQPITGGYSVGPIDPVVAPGGGIASFIQRNLLWILAIIAVIYFVGGKK